MKSWGCEKHFCLRHSGKKSNHCCRWRRVAGAHGRIIDRCSRAFFGCSKPVHAGAICPKNIQARPPVGDGWHGGKCKGCGSIFGVPFFRNWTRAAHWIGKKVFWMPASLQQKKGRLRRQNQAWQGHEVDGGGRRLGCSSGKPTGLGQPSGSHARGKHLEKGFGATAPRSRPQPASARDCRSRLQQRSAALAPTQTRHSFDHAAPQEPQETFAQRWQNACDPIANVGK
jgi:hypothetical protein